MQDRSANFFNDQDVLSGDLNFIESARRYKDQEGLTTLLDRWGVADAVGGSALKVVKAGGTFSVSVGRAIDIYGRIINVPESITSTDIGMGVAGEDDYRPAGTLPVTVNIPLEDYITSGVYINITYASVSGSNGVDDEGVEYPTRYYDSYTISQDATAGVGTSVPLARVTVDGTLVDTRQFMACWSGASSANTIEEHLQKVHSSGLTGTTFNASGEGSLGAAPGTSIVVNQIVSGDALFLSGNRYTALDGNLTVPVSGAVGQTLYIWAESISTSSAEITSSTTAPTWTATKYAICSGVIVAGGGIATLTDLRRYLCTTGDNVRDVSTIKNGVGTVTQALESLKAADAAIAAAYTAADTALQVEVDSIQQLAGREIVSAGVSDAQYWKICDLPATSDTTYDKVKVELVGGAYESTDVGTDIVTFANRGGFVYGNSEVSRSTDTQTTLRIVAYRATSTDAGTVGLYIHKPSGVLWASGVARAWGVGVSSSYTSLPIADPTTAPVDADGTSYGYAYKCFDSGDTVTYPVTAGDRWSRNRFNETTGHTHAGTAGNGPQLLTSGIADANVTPAKLRLPTYRSSMNTNVAAWGFLNATTITLTLTDPYTLVFATANIANTSAASVSIYLRAKNYDSGIIREIGHIFALASDYSSKSVTGLIVLEPGTWGIELQNRGASIALNTGVLQWMSCVVLGSASGLFAAS